MAADMPDSIKLWSDRDHKSSTSAKEVMFSPVSVCLSLTKLLKHY